MKVLCEIVASSSKKISLKVFRRGKGQNSKTIKIKLRIIYSELRISFYKTGSDSDFFVGENDLPLNCISILLTLR